MSGKSFTAIASVVKLVHMTEIENNVANNL